MTEVHETQNMLIVACVIVNIGVSILFRFSDHEFYISLLDELLDALCVRGMLCDHIQFAKLSTYLKAIEFICSGINLYNVATEKYVLRADQQNKFIYF